MDTENVSDVGHGKTYDEVVQKYDKEHGEYKGNVQPSPSGVPAMGPVQEEKPFKLGGE